MNTILWVADDRGFEMRALGYQPKQEFGRREIMRGRRFSAYSVPLRASQQLVAYLGKLGALATLTDQQYQQQDICNF
jgi:hypothetical protein